MQNLSLLRQRLLELSAAITWAPDQARSLCDQALMELTKLDPLTKSQMLAGTDADLPVTPNYYDTGANPRDYQAGRLLEQLGMELDNASMKKVAEQTRPFADSINAARSRNQDMVNGECVSGKPPIAALEGVAGVAVVDARAWVSQTAEKPAEARQHAYQAVADRLKAERQNATDKKRKA